MRAALLALALLLGAAAPALAHPEDEGFVLRNPTVLAMSSADYVVEGLVRRG